MLVAADVAHALVARSAHLKRLHVGELGLFVHAARGDLGGQRSRLSGSLGGFFCAEDELRNSFHFN